jgi:hypothetical protein
METPRRDIDRAQARPSARDRRSWAGAWCWNGTSRPGGPERARRRTFTAQYKLEIVPAYDAAPDGEKGALLRREGLYSSHIVECDATRRK